MTPSVAAAAENDRFMPLERTRALADLLSQSRFTILPDLGHAAVIEAPELVAGLVS